MSDSETPPPSPPPSPSPPSSPPPSPPPTPFEDNPLFKRDAATSMTRSIWDCTSFILRKFAEANPEVDINQAYEVCGYQARMISGELSFKDSKFSGLEKYSWLASLMEFSVSLGFQFASEQDRLRIEHDIAIALSTSKLRARYVKTSFVAIFNSDGNRPKVEDEEDKGTCKFYDFSYDAYTFIFRLLKQKDVGAACRSMRAEIQKRIQDGNHRSGWEDFEFEGEEVDDDTTASTDELWMRNLLEQVAIRPCVTTRPEATAILFRYASASVSEYIEEMINKSVNIQDVFSIALELFLMSILETNPESGGRATKFVATVKTDADRPEDFQFSRVLASIPEKETLSETIPEEEEFSLVEPDICLGLRVGPKHQVDMSVSDDYIEAFEQDGYHVIVSKIYKDKSCYMDKKIMEKMRGELAKIFNIPVERARPNLYFVDPKYFADPKFFVGE
mgnify:CR=1 FL=1